MREWHRNWRFDSLAYVAQHLIEQIDCGGILRAVCIAFSSTASDHQTRAAQLQQRGDLVYLTWFHAGFTSNARPVITLYQLGHIASRRAQRIDDTQRQNTFRTGTHREPAIGIRTGQGHF